MVTKKGDFIPKTLKIYYKTREGPAARATTARSSMREGGAIEPLCFFGPATVFLAAGQFCGR